VTALLVAAAVIAGTGAVAALAPIDVRLGLIGLTASLVGAALLADPLPSPAVLAVRLTAALLAVVTLRAAMAAPASRRDGDARGWSGHPAAARIGWPVEALLGVAGGVAGLAIAGGITVFNKVGGGDIGQLPAPVATDLLAPTSLALGIAGLLAAIAVGPLLTEPTGARRAMAAILLAQAVILVRMALAPAPGVLDEVVFGTLLVAVAAAGAMLTAAAAVAARHAALAGAGGHLARSVADPHPRRS